MNSILVDKFEIDIDLAFQGFLDEKMLALIDHDTRNLIRDSKTWVENFKKWLAFIRNDEKILCPEIIRTNTKFSFGLQFTDDNNIALLNNEWRKNSSSTDVLSFPAIDESMMQFSNNIIELGDIIVSVPTAFKQAKEYNHSLAKELTWLVSHGFLHLLGWDHPTSKTLNEMLDFQDKLLQTQSEFHDSASGEVDKA